MLVIQYFSDISAGESILKRKSAQDVKRILQAEHSKWNSGPLGYFAKNFFYAKIYLNRNDNCEKNEGAQLAWLI